MFVTYYYMVNNQKYCYIVSKVNKRCTEVSVWSNQMYCPLKLSLAGKRIEWKSYILFEKTFKLSFVFLNILAMLLHQGNFPWKRLGCSTPPYIAHYCICSTSKPLYNESAVYGCRKIAHHDVSFFFLVRNVFSFE